jgi:hypothetical protein
MQKVQFLILAQLINLLSYAAIGQDVSFDKLVLTNGEEKIGQVTEIGDTYVKFVHKGETLIYTLKKEKISKIQFASGRIEFFEEAELSASQRSDSTSALQSHHNIVAVLPFTYIGQGGSRDQKLGIKIQSDCYNVLKKYADQFILQDPITTNALLIKHNINEENIMGFTPSELTNILNAEYIIYGNVTVNDKGSKSGNANYATGKNKGNKYTGILLGTSSTTRLFTTTVDMKIYTDLGQNIFGQSHESFWQTENAYEVTLQYLIKRTPLYRK